MREELSLSEPKNSVAFTADHHSFYHQEASFFPLIQEETFPLMNWSNVVLLRLPAQLNDDLKWSKERALAKEIIQSGKYILWEIDLGLSQFQFTPEDSTAFFSFSLAIEEFTTQIWPDFCSQTFGVAIYKGPCPSQKNFPLIHWEIAFLEWQQALNLNPLETHYDLYCIQMLGEYLHRLISFLPEAILPFAIVDATPLGSPMKIAQFFSKERFEHIHLVLKGAQYPFIGIGWDQDHSAQGILSKTPREEHLLIRSDLGVYLPKDRAIDTSCFHELEAILSQLHNIEKNFRIINEEKLTEQWDGIDQLIVPKHAMSAQGRRKLLGFMAAGGIIIDVDGAIVNL